MGLMRDLVHHRHDLRAEDQRRILPRLAGRNPLRGERDAVLEVKLRVLDMIDAVVSQIGNSTKASPET